MQKSIRRIIIAIIRLIQNIYLSHYFPKDCLDLGAKLSFCIFRLRRI